VISIRIVIPAPISIGINSSRNPGFPVKTATYYFKWLPTGVYPVMIWGRDDVWMPDQVRHDGKRLCMDPDY
jgi:hypothetical protein